MEDAAAAGHPRPRVLVIGCGNLLRGDDGVGPECVRRLRQRGLPSDVGCTDGGTGGLDVAFEMRGVPEVILVDACSSGSEPGSLFEVPGDEVADLAPPGGFHSHAFRWDHALAWARSVLGEGFPAKVTALLVEGARYEVGTGLSPSVDHAVDRLVDILYARIGATAVEVDALKGRARGENRPRADATAAITVAGDGGGRRVAGSGR